MTDDQIDALIDRHYRHMNHPDSYAALRATIRDALAAAPAQPAEQAAAHDNATLERGIQLGMYRERQRAEALAQQAQIDHAVVTTGEAWVMPDGRVLNALDVRARPPAQAEPVAPRIVRWGHCWTCNHDAIPGEGCARTECPMTKPLSPSNPPAQGAGDFDAWLNDRYPDREDRQAEFRSTSVHGLMQEAWSIAFGAGCVHGEEVARAALAKAPAAEPQWQPIETAPKDGTHLLLWWDDEVREGWCAGAAKARDGGDWWRAHSLVVCKGRPTLWQPMPKPPDA